MGRSVATFGLSGVTNTNVTSNYTSDVNERLFADSSSSTFTITLPATPNVGDAVQIIDVAGNFSINNVTVGRNGEKIQNLEEDLIMNLDNAAVTFVYSGATYGWVFSGI
jgi:hypothetical protein